MANNDIKNTLGINKDRPFITTIYDSGVVNMGAQPILLPNNPIKATNPVDCLLIKLLVTTVVGTGTLASVPIFDALSNLQINDKDNKQIFNFLGSDVIFEAYARSLIQSKFLGQNDQMGNLGAGATSLTTNIASGSNVVTVLLRCPIKNKDLPLHILGNFAALSSIFSTLGTATATIELVIDTISYPTVDPVYTLRSGKYNTGAQAAIGATTDISKLIPDSYMIDAMVLDIGSDNNISSLTLDPQGNNVGMITESMDSIKQIETARLQPAGRQPGFVVLDVGKFTKVATTVFQANVGTAFTPYAIVLYHPIADEPKVIVPSASLPNQARIPASTNAVKKS